MTPGDRRMLRDHGITLGRLVICAAPLLSPAALRKRRALCTAELWPGARPPVVGDETLAFSLSDTETAALSDAVYNALGYPRFGAIAVRADQAEAIVEMIDEGASVLAVAGHLGCAVDQVSTLVTELRDQQPRQARRRGRRRS